MNIFLPKGVADAVSDRIIDIIVCNVSSNLHDRSDRGMHPSKEGWLSLLQHHGRGDPGVDVDRQQEAGHQAGEQEEEAETAAGQGCPVPLAPGSLVSPRLLLLLVTGGSRRVGPSTGRSGLPIGLLHGTTHCTHHL